MNRKILLVDDDDKILASYQRSLRKDFDVFVANGGEEGLRILVENGPFAVVVSDFKMPVMNGVEFLSEALQAAPDTVRMMLTGYVELENAMNAVNRGHVFRFLTKPCPIDLLRKSLEEGIDQYQLVLNQRELYSLKRATRTMEGIIFSFATLVEKRDPYTAGHQRRVASLAAAIGTRMGLDEERVFGLKMAGIVHDIGKIYVPQDFLNKPGRLSEAEFAIIKEHTVVGHEIFKSVEFDWPIDKVILQHHERLDGSGYPNGLKGDEILLEARITAVADVVDAMNSHRPYRPGLGMTAALGEIEEHRGVLYDPEAVDACLALIRNEGFEFED